MTLNVIAILLSLAMMLTGVGGEGQPAEVSRNLVLSNVNITYNGETLHLTPQARVGVSTDGRKAVFDFGVDLNDAKLLPVQLGVSEAGATLLFGGQDVAVTVTDKALKGLEAEFNETLTSAFNTIQSEDADLIGFITGEYLPAYIAVLNAATDSELQKEMEASFLDLYDQKVQRGEGAATTVQFDGQTYDATAYSYTLDTMQLARLCDEMYTSVPVLADYYNAMFKLYGMLPDEAGLSDIHSYADLFEKTGIAMSAEIEEKIAEDGEIDVLDAVLTIDVSAAVTEESEEVFPEVFEEETEEEAAEEAEAEEPEEDDGENIPDGVEPEGDEPDALDPIVLVIHSTKVGEYLNAQFNCAYDVDENHGFEIEMISTREGSTQDLEMDMTVIENNEPTQRGKASIFLARDDEGGCNYSVNIRYIQQDTSKLDASFYGMRDADGTSDNTVSVDVRTKESNAGVSFDLTVTADAIADAANGHEAAYVIDEISGTEGLEPLFRDQAFTELMAKVAGSFSADIARLAEDDSVKDLMTLLNEGRLPIDVADLDDDDYGFTYEIDGDGEDPYSYMADGDDDYAYAIDGEDEVVYDDEQAEDDGVLGFTQPQLTWLPEGWTVSATNVDTAYDFVELSVANAEGEDTAYVLFLSDPENETASYVIGSDGATVEGRVIDVADFGDGNLSVTVRENGLYGSLMFASEAVDMDTIGRIVAGIQF